MTELLHFWQNENNNNNNKSIHVFIKTTCCGTLVLEGGHFFPRLRSYITCHHRFADIPAIKRTGRATVSNERRSAGQCEIFSSPALYFTFVFRANRGLCFFFFFIRSFLLRFHLLTAGKVRVTSLAVPGTLPVRNTYV